MQNQDNREHDLLDSDDYYQFEGGLAAAVTVHAGRAPALYHNDHSVPDNPRIRTLADELGRVVRARVTNPKWIAGVMRHGYKGAFEIAATVDYLFAFAATTGAVKNHHFDAVFDAYVADDDVRDFMADANPAALRELAERLLEAQERSLWRPRANHAHALLGGAPRRQAGGTLMANETEAELDRRHAEKMRKRKAARERMLATKTIEKGLLIVHTGKGKGKSTAAFGLAARAIGNGMKVGVVQFVKGKWATGERTVLERLPRPHHGPRDGRGLHLGHAGSPARPRRRAQCVGGGARISRRPLLPPRGARRAQHRAPLRLSRSSTPCLRGLPRATLTNTSWSPAATRSRR